MHDPLTVLIADDAPTIRDRLLAMLGDVPGVEVIGKAADGDEAIRLVRELSPDLLILDIRMPRRGGFEVLELVRAEHPATRAIVCTNYPYEQYRDRATELGALHFVDKGKDLSTVRDLVTALVDERSG